MKKTMNHGEYQKAMRSKSDAELNYIARDAYEAIQANPDGLNAGYYADEVNYAASELHRRRTGGK